MTYPVNMVSLGPGEAGLITWKGLQLLQAADKIFYPATGSQSRAFDILTDLQIPLSRLQAFRVPMSKARSETHAAYRRVAEEVKEAYNEGLHIALVAEGDANLYSSSHYISELLASERIPVETVPGIPAFIACGALAHVHLAKQEEELHIVPGTITGAEIERRLSEKRANLVIMKASQCEASIKEFIAKHPDILLHYFENTGIAGKEFYSHHPEEIRARSFPYFSLIIIPKQI
ncbi:precorrin-2 C(20)-methyltransferase [Limibacterium fermenti]|uniref:precorrin-2 C(20)-methyltransferase n=1 Tax=Limibacterium fermenti TaxID=3229863 RepID=UPI000E88BBF3|nr:precorrin-2 C(20)-methyltransferase [Porphyromonadaceae bacterium]HBX46172.1 precorrin-2 C(20)-methyltransferase [Porphyromonadaceae bacterium]